MHRFVAVALVSAVLAAYPLLVWLGLAHIGAPALLGLLLVALGLRMVFVARGRLRRRALFVALLLIAAGFAAAVTGTGSGEQLRWYPVLASLVASATFGVSLVAGRPLIERFARLRTPELPPEGVAYTRRLTVAWTLLTFGNALVAAWTARYASMETWALYNGLVSYLLLGGFFVAERVYRRHRFGDAAA